MTNVTQKPILGRADIKTKTPIMQVLRLAYEEVQQGLPPNYDNHLLRDDAHCQNYERVRIACLSAMRVHGALPKWRKNTLVPLWLALEVLNFNQEIQFGLEMNLVVDLSPGTHEVEASRAY